MLNRGLTRYLSPKALKRLAEAQVGIAGAGGLGSNCAMLLVRSGIKRLTIVDFDTVEASNLNRQYFLPSDVGRPKVEALGEHLLSLSPDLQLNLVNARLSVENATSIFKNCCIVVEALDKAEYKAALIGALLAGPSDTQADGPAHLVSASGLGGLGGPTMRKKRLGQRLICVGDFESAVNDECPPLAPRVMQAAALEAEAVLELLLENKNIL